VNAAVHERRGSRGRTLFEPTIEFRYKFSEREHVGHRVTFGDVATGNRADAVNLAERFAVGTSWEVRICESHPELSVLQPGPTGRLWFSVAFFLVYTAFAASFLVEAIQRWRH
jgi:hypothetical protein